MFLYVLISLILVFSFFFCFFESIGTAAVPRQMVCTILMFSFLFIVQFLPL